MESLRLSGTDKKEWRSPFTFHALRGGNYNYWVGVNLSTRSWPLWSVSYRGREIFRGHLFDRASPIADFYIPFPSDLQESGELKLTLLREPYRAAYSYEVHSIELIEETARDFEIVSAPHYLSLNKGGALLIEINKPGTTLRLSADRSLHLDKQQYRFDQCGLYTIPVCALKCGVKLPITLSDGRESRVVYVGQVLDRTEDHVYVSSGDEIYIDKEYSVYDYFFKWYIRERIGNWYQFRPSYQWSGVRQSDPKVIQHYLRLLEDLQMPFAWQVEGRTLAGSQINVPLESLQSPFFRGKQAHENDGGYYYWQHFTYNGLLSDLAARARPYGGIFAKHRPIYTDRGVYIHYDPNAVKDMAQGAASLVENLAYSRGESSRHTGPSTLFRYLYQAGYDWVGAEQMYGPEETVMSALRGASRAYGKTDYGTLHAMQWGSAPFTDSKHALRYYLSLATAYMHGSTHINTEEGLWTDEYSNDRYSESGRQHSYANRRMVDYVETHARMGTMVNRIAVVQGRNDPWKCFGRSSLWSQKGESWKFGKAQESFDLIHLFYPQNMLNAAPPEGWFTSTPYGTIDLLPIEASSEVYSSYRAMIFLGWNNYDEGDFKRLTEYVEQGGTLLLGAVHLNEELQPDQSVRFPKMDRQIRMLLGENYQEYTSKQEIRYGKGKVIYFPNRTYPADETLRGAYEHEMRAIAEESVSQEKSRGWINHSPQIGFAVWDTPKMRTLYALNLDWQSETVAHPLVFSLNGFHFSLEVAPYELKTVVCGGNVAVVPASNTSSVISVDEHPTKWLIKVQTTESDVITVCNALTGKTSRHALRRAGIHTLKISK